MDEAAVARQHVANLHSVRAAVEDELLVEAHRVERGRGLEVVCVLVRAGIRWRQAVAAGERACLVVDAFLEVEVDAEPVAAGQDI